MSFLPDRGAQYAALRGCRENDGVPGPGPQADLQGGDHLALRAGARPPPAEAVRANKPLVFCIYSEQAAQREAKMSGAQRTREAYS
jgi:hypothetical protein